MVKLLLPAFLLISTATHALEVTATNSQNIPVTAVKTELNQEILTLIATIQALGSKLKQTQDQINTILACSNNNQFYDEATNACSTTSSNTSNQSPGQACAAQNFAWGSARDWWNRPFNPCSAQAPESGHSRITYIYSGRRQLYNRFYSGSQMMQCIDGNWQTITSSCADVTPVYNNGGDAIGGSGP